MQNPKNLTPRLLFLTGMVLAAALSRLIPHPPNFSPIASLALFGGVNFTDKRTAFIVPLAAMLLSDLILGLHLLLPIVYGSFALITCLGFWVRRRQAVWRVGSAVLTGAILFFILTNLGVWLVGAYYPKTCTGLIECYIAAVPFFGNTLAGDVCYTVLLFGGLWTAERCWTALRPTAAAAGM